jgi:hypothetical protein
MKKSALLIFSILTMAAPGFAQEGYSPTLPFGTKEYQVTRYPTVSPVPPAQQYYNSNPYYNYYNNYYYGPYGVYNNSYSSARQRQGAAPSPQYKSSNHDRLPKSHLQNDQLPSYNNSSSSPSLPGY